MKPKPIKKVTITHHECPVCDKKLNNSYTSDGLTDIYICVCGYWYKDSHDNGVTFNIPPNDRFEECPDCGENTVVAKGLYGGGVECVNPGCHYWFCY